MGTALSIPPRGADLGTIDAGLLAQVANDLDLRPPNREAIGALARRLAEHDGAAEVAEAVLHVATGVGKTYIMAGAMEYLAGRGVRHFAIITPNATILRKTVAQFTAGHDRSLADAMSAPPTLITADNFRTPETHFILDTGLDARVNLFIFTVQALTRPQAGHHRRTHRFQETLGDALYAHLQRLDDLVVFADEHHSYFGPAFARAVRELHPRALVGLTATLHASTPPERVIYRYPLGAAIAERLVKTPVVVGRRDDLTDWQTQLRDGVRLLEVKQRAVDAHCRTIGRPPFRAVMLVNCTDTAHADEVGAFMRAQHLLGEGAADDAVLVVHSNRAERDLQRLEGVDDPRSPVRVIIQVGMLKEGWDVRSVYVLVSLRASVSEILTEQTMGRGLRLPFGRYTGIDMLDTLDIVTHDRYEALLRDRSALNSLIIGAHADGDGGRSERAAGGGPPAAHGGDGGGPTPAPSGRSHGRGETASHPTPAADDTPSVADAAPPPAAGTPLPSASRRDGNAPTPSDGRPVGPRITALDERLDGPPPPPPTPPRDGLPSIRVPLIDEAPIAQSFSLAHITDLGPYRDLGRRLAGFTDDVLHRQMLRAELSRRADGSVAVAVHWRPEGQRVAAASHRLDDTEARRRAIARVLNHRAIPARSGDTHHVSRLLDAVREGLGDRAEEVLGRFPDTVGHSLLATIAADRAAWAAGARGEPLIRVGRLEWRPRPGRATASPDRYGRFSRDVDYTGWERAGHERVNFDSSTERTMANLLDAEPTMALWTKLARNELPILWDGGRRSYNPDFLAITADTDRWLIETKADRDVDRDDVRAKRESAQVWVNTVNASEVVAERWHYLLVTESDLKLARDSWGAVVELARP